MPPDPAFHPTRWTMVWRARGQGPEAFRALSDLCAAYHFPLYSFARRRGLEPPDAEDATQSFFTRMIEKDLFALADESRGQLRTFLLTAFQNHMQSDRRRATSAKRGGTSPHLPLPGSGDDEIRYCQEPADPHTPETLYERTWARQVLAAALTRTEAEWTTAGHARAFATLHPFLSGAWHTSANFTDAAATLGIAVHTARQRAASLRQDYRRHLLHEIGETIADHSPAAIEEELHHFMRVLET